MDTFTVSIRKEVTRIDNNGEETADIYLYNLSEGIYRIKSKFRHDDKICETCGIKYKYCDCFLEYSNSKNINSRI